MALLVCSIIAFRAWLVLLGENRSDPDKHALELPLLEGIGNPEVLDRRESDGIVGVVQDREERRKNHVIRLKCLAILRADGACAAFVNRDDPLVLYNSAPAGCDPVGERQQECPGVELRLVAKTQRTVGADGNTFQG
jgi:hypothetical protein